MELVTWIIHSNIYKNVNRRLFLDDKVVMTLYQ